MLNRRDLFKVAGAATVAAAVPAAGAAPAAKEAAKTAVKKYKGGVVAGPVLKGQNELKLSRTFDLGKSVLNDAEVMNASHWGQGSVAAAAGARTAAVQRRSHPLPDGSQELSGKGL